MTIELKLGKFYTYSELGDGSRVREGGSGGHSYKTVADRTSNPELAKRVMGRINERLSEFGQGDFQSFSDEKKDEILERDLRIIVDSPAKIELKFRRRVSCEGYDFNEIMGEALFMFYWSKNYNENLRLSIQDLSKEDLPSFSSKKESEFGWIPGPNMYGLILKYNFDIE